MAIILKSRREIEMMRAAGKLACEILAKMRRSAVAGATTLEIDELAAAEMHAAGAVSLSHHYPHQSKGEAFPGYTCISVNEEIVHGIPGKRVLKEGDVASLDLALSLDGYCADTATTIPVGAIGPTQRKLLDVTKRTLALAIQQIKPGKRWSEIARLMQHNVESNGFNVVRDFVGHGVGRAMHEDPKVPNFVTARGLRSDFMLRSGMTLAVEPMVVAGGQKVIELADGWTQVTADGKPAAHFEHTIAVTDVGVEILTDGRVQWEL